MFFCQECLRFILNVNIYNNSFVVLSLKYNAYEHLAANMKYYRNVENRPIFGHNYGQIISWVFFLITRYSCKLSQFAKNNDHTN